MSSIESHFSQGSEKAESDEPANSDSSTTQRKSRLKRLSKQLDEMLESVFIQQQEIPHEALGKVKQEHSRQLHSLRLQQHLKDSQYQFSLQQAQNRTQDLQKQNQCLWGENQKLKRALQGRDKQLQKVRHQLERAHRKTKNQQLLIDEYKNSLEQQISLQKQVIKSTYQEREKQQKCKFQDALRAMQKNYEAKLRKMEYNNLRKDYQQDLKSMKKFCKGIGNKENKQISQPHSLLGTQDINFKGGISSYSTLAREN